jgi:hypothetical protein
MFFHPIQLLVCIVVAYGWHVFLTKEKIPTDKVEVFGRRLSEQDILLAATACTFDGRPALAWWLVLTLVTSCSDDGLPALLRLALRHLRAIRFVRCPAA